MPSQDQWVELNRRDFLRGGSYASLLMMLGGGGAMAADAASEVGTTAYRGQATPVNCAVIGCGTWGREILRTLSRLPQGPVVAVCDTHEMMLRRGAELAPHAEKFTDSQKLLAQPEVQAVVVATPSHRHKDIALAALAAGKHVYCEAPLAHTVADARAIARAAAAEHRVHFQSGLQARSDPQLRHLADFVRSGALGKVFKARGQWHRKQSWRRTSSNPEREQELNWRLGRATSPGLPGEFGVHQCDLAHWLLQARPEAVTAAGSLAAWADDREVPDTVWALFEYPAGVRFAFEASLGTSFEGDSQVFFGTDSAVLTRDRRAWMFKEADSPLLGWEVYARKESFCGDTGIVLGANATKLKAQADPAAPDAPPPDPLAADETPLHYALKAFLTNAATIGGAVEDFASAFDLQDRAALQTHLAGLAKSMQPHATAADGLAATVAALHAHTASLDGGRVRIDPGLYEPG